MANRPWIAFFSQTGSEIVQVSKNLGRYPDAVVFNTSHLGREMAVFVSERRQKVRAELNSNFVTIPFNPTSEHYEGVLELYENPLITLNGWLRIVPAEICEKYEMYNGHPGLITKYPELKGKDPQAKAHKMGLKESGCVIHRVTPGVDEGPILMSDEVIIDKLSLEATICTLHHASCQLWTDFLRGVL